MTESECNDCGECFHDEDLIWQTDNFGADYVKCPKCGSEDLVEL